MPDVLCDVRSSVCVLPEVCGTVRGVHLCVRSYARGVGVSVSDILREVWSYVLDILY